MRFLVAASVAVAVANVPVAYAFEPKWPAGSYRYLVIDQDIKDVLAEFGHNVGLPTHVGEEIRVQRVTGPLPDANARAFLGDVCAAYGVVWYYDGATLYFNAASEVKSEMVNLGRLLRSDMVIRQLEKTGVADERYFLRATADAHVISISGPPSYRKLVRQEIIAMAKSLESGVLVVRAGRGG
jgi:type III secretion protein C